jgi:hypothetical protein
MDLGQDANPTERIYLGIDTAGYQHSVENGLHSQVVVGGCIIGFPTIIPIVLMQEEKG